MTTIVQPSDFIGEFNIPDKATISENLQWFINKYEAKLLTELMGVQLYNLFDNGRPRGTVQTVSGGLIVFGTDTFFKTMFKPGDSITVVGETHIVDFVTDDTHLNTVDVWDGNNLNTADYYGEKRYVDLVPLVQPAIVCYVYWYYLSDQSIQNLGTGAGQSKKTNARTVSPYPKMVRAWNEMVTFCRKFHKYMVDNKDIYPEYKVCFPEWFWGWGYWFGSWCMWFFDFSDWGWRDYGCIPEIYRFKNTLGI